MILMNFFIDTNIGIGFTVIHDKWHAPANNFLNNYHQEPIFWSTLTQMECCMKLDEIIDDVDFFLKYTENILKDTQNDFINYASFEKYVISKTKECHLGV